MLMLCPTANAQQWTDVTDVFITNPTFDTDNSGWEILGSCSSYGVVNYGCLEFWNGWFNISQELEGLPKGKYRMSVQAYYRCGDFGNIYQNYIDGNESIPAQLYVEAGGDVISQPLVSVFSESFHPGWTWGSDWWSPDNNNYYPNSMWAASSCFEEGKYWNTLEFEADGNAIVAIYCYDIQGSNWCIFDNFKLEYAGTVVKATSVKVNAEKKEMLVGEKLQLTATVMPENTLQKAVTWSTSKASVATVDENGLVTATGPGSVTITATTTDGSNKRGSITLSVSHNEAIPGSFVINEIMASNVDQFISPAFNFDGWIELYNTTNQGIELAGLSLTNDAGEQWTITQEVGVLPANGYKVIWFDSNDLAPQNVPFKLDVDGGTISISDSKGQVITSQTYPSSMERVSYARTTDNGDTWRLTDTPTPNATNNGSKFADRQIEAPVVDMPSQLFTGQLSVNVKVPAGCTLRYTTDGSLPTLESKSAVGQFRVNETTIYRFRLFSNSMLASPVTSRSYIFKDREYYLPVVSVISDRDFLYSREIGVMSKGPNGRPGNGQGDKCNWNMNWERPVNFSYLDENGDMVLNQDVNLEMCGGWSRAWTPHAFKLKGNKEFGGNKNLPYPFFTQKPYIRNRTLQIRNGGNDNGCRFKDAALAYIVQTSGMDVDVQSYQPVHEFINGTYIGVLNVREPNNKHYVYANFGWDDDEIDQWEMSPDSGYVQKCGTPDVYNELVDVLSPDAANSETYQEICQQLDIDEFINYMAIQFYYAGNDWPRNNVKAFRYRDGGKFRFVLFDVDAAFSYGDDVFNQFMNKEWWWFDELYPRGTGSIYDQIRMVTLFKNLLQNADFRRKFIDTYCLVSGSVFEVNRARTILEELYDRVQPAMQLNGESSFSSYSSLRSSVGNRLATATRAIKNFSTFGLSSVPAQRVRLSSDTEGAKLLVNGQQVPTGKFDGNLFAPVTLKAVAPAGYAFQGWAGNAATNNSTLKAKGSLWYYYDQGSLDGKNWMSPTYSTSSWKLGYAPLGYSNNEAITTQLNYGTDSNNKRPTYYFRSTVVLDQAPVNGDEFLLDYHIDDGFVIYVNGSEAGRFNMPNGTISYNTYASTYADQFPTGTLSLPYNLFHKGSNVIAVEVHNNAANSTDIIWDASIVANLSSNTTPEYLSTDAEYVLPNGNNLQLTACYRPLTDSEMQEECITPVRINEVSGSNSAFINEYGKKNDWVELYNTTDEDIDVEGMFLTDNVDKPEKYMISKENTSANTTIPAHGYLIIWCDKLATTNQALHASFKVSGEGGQLMLTAADRKWKDMLTYTAHDGNSTVGRYPDGTSAVYLMNVPTIEKSNVLSSYVTAVGQSPYTAVRSTLIASANGFRIRYGAQQLVVKDEATDQATVEIFTSDGRLLERQHASLQRGTAIINVAHLSSGFYVARATNADGTRVSCKFIK
jgi:hypothetical protein